MKRSLGIASLALATVFVAIGCGGGSGSSGATSPSATDFAFGEMSGRAAISNPPVSTSTQAIIGTAFTGTFSTLKIRELNPSLSETRIVATSDVFGTFGLVNFAIDGSDPQRMTNAFDMRPSASGNGKVVFIRSAIAVAHPSATTPGFLAQPIDMVNLDGSGFVNMTSGQRPSIDYAGDKFAYISGAPGISVMNVATKAITPLVLPLNTTAVMALCISPDGNTVYATLNISGNNFLYAIPANGSAGAAGIAPLSPFVEQELAINPAGTELAFEVSGTPNSVTRIGVNGEVGTTMLLQSSDFDGLNYSADGTELVAGTQPSGESAGLYVNGIKSAEFLNRITTDTSSALYPTWTPFVKDRTLISGGGGLLGTRACGVIFGQRAIGGTTSVVAFDVTTPSSVVMTAQPNNLLSQTNLVFSVDADSITKLAYANTTSWRGIRAIGSGTPVTSANGALVSIDGILGNVVSVLPFTGTRALGSHPTVTDSGSVRTFSGSFLAVYDKDGKNLAPNGANVVTLDTTTGVLSVQH